MPIHTRKAASGAALLFLIAISSTHAEPSLELDAVTVTASRIPEAASDSPPAVEVVTSADIAARGATTMAEALKSVPGLGISSPGPEGSLASVSIRGSSSNQVLVLVDGVRANDALTGQVDLSRIALDRVERIEVMRGGGSSLYGGDAVGGVVNIITRKDAAPLVLKLENGAYLPTARVVGLGFNKAEEAASAASLVDSQKASFSWGPSIGAALLRFAGAATRAVNAYTFIDSNGEKRAREGASLLSGDGSMGATVPLGTGSLSADFSGYYGLKGVPGSESLPSPRATEADTSAGAVVNFKTERFLSDLLTLDATAKLDWSGIDYVDPDAPSNDGHHRILTGSIEAAQLAYLWDGLTLAYGGGISYAVASSDAVGSPQRAAAGAYFEPAFSLGSLSVRPSLRYDYYSDFSANDLLAPLGAALGANLKLSESDSLKLNLSRAYRVPSFNDLYWPDQGGAAGNPLLKPETAYELNLGFERSEAGLVYEASAYLRYAQDVILWQPGTDGTWRPSNFGSALYPGLEQELKARLGRGYSLSASYAYLHSFVLSGGLSLADDRRLPMTSVHSLKAIVSYEGERLSWSATGAYASLRYLKTANVGFLPSYLTLDAILHWKISSTTTAYLAADNLFDEQYALVDGYPMPGTRLRIGYEFKF